MMTTPVGNSGDGDHENPFDPLFRKIKRQWEEKSFVLEHSTESSGPRQERDGSSERSPPPLAPARLTPASGPDTECFVVLVQHSLGSNLRIRSSGGSGGGATTGGGVGGRPGSSSSVPSGGDATRTSATSSSTLYDRAGVKSPSERAWRDLHGSTAWLEGIADSLAKVSDSLIWLQTLAIRRKGSGYQERRRRNVQEIDAARDPFGWSSENGEISASSGPNLENLDQLIQSIRQRVESTTATPNAPLRRFVPVMVQSLTPILHRHGFRRTLAFVRDLQKCCPVLVVPVEVETMTRDQHLLLEGMASAVLAVEHGIAVLLRRGVRECTNVVRELLELDLDDPDPSDEVGGGSGSGPRSNRIEGSTPGGRRRPRIRRVIAVVAPSSSATTTGSSDATNAAASGTTSVRPMPPTAAGKSRVQLTISDDDAPRAVPGRLTSSRDDKDDGNPPQPRIIVQDDDPEFDDYDEEDPDDDLDL